MIFKIDDNYINYQLIIIILFLLRKTFKILESHNYNLIISLFYHFRKDVNKDLRDGL